jgi:hypothetical protein
MFYEARIAALPRYTPGGWSLHLVTVHKDGGCSVETSQRGHSSRQREIPPLGNLEQGRRDPLVFVTSGAAAGGAGHSQIAPSNLWTLCWGDKDEGLTEIIGFVGAVVYAMLFELRL